MGGGAGFGNQPKSYSLRVTIIGHASPRWKDAKNDKEADRKNEALANMRSQTIRDAVERLLRKQLGDNVRIAFDQSYAEGDRPDIAVGGYGVGSREALERVDGDRHSNQEQDRKVDIKLDLITTNYYSGGVSLPSERISAVTRFWYVKVTRLRMTAVGVAFGEIEMVLRNSISGKTMMASATLYLGGGLAVNVGKATPISQSDPRKIIATAAAKRAAQAAADAFGRKEVSFYTEHPMGFSEFNDQWVRVGKGKAAIIVGGSFVYLTFPFLGEGAATLKIEGGFTLAFGLAIEAYLSSGKLRLLGLHPGDYFESDRSADVSSSVDHRSDQTLTLTFPTQSQRLPDLETSKLEKFISGWTASRTGGP